jgi:hypothetical protein
MTNLLTVASDLPQRNFGELRTSTHDDCIDTLRELTDVLSTWHHRGCWLKMTEVAAPPSTNDYGCRPERAESPG